MSHGSIADLFQPAGPQRQLTGAEQAQIKAFRERERELGVTEREMVVGNAWLFCSCQPTWQRVTADTPPAHASCAVHHGFMITWDGRVL
jgi:hypothetical protein